MPSFLRQSGVRRGIATGIAVFVWLQAMVCAAQQDPVDEDDQVSQATHLLESGEVAAAETLVRQLNETMPDNRQLRFLQAHLAIIRGEPDRALSLFRGLLSEDPSLIRVRLDLAKLLYEKGNYEAARYHFELALGSDIPDTVRHNVQAYLERLRFSESYLNISVFVSNDSNINQGPSASTIYLFGLPFTLSSTSQPKRATGLVTFADGRLAFGPEHRSYIVANVEDREYDGTGFNYRFVQGGLGHSIPLASWRVGVEGGYFDSWFQEKPLSDGPWARIYAWTKLGPRVLVTPSVQKRWNHYPAYPFLSGSQDTASLDTSMSVTPTFLTTIGVSGGKNSASDAVFGYNSAEMRLGAVKELPLGLIVQAQIARTISRYDEQDPLFQEMRRDTQTRTEISMTERNWAVLRFAPILMFSTTKNRSTIPLYTWERNFLGIGVTTKF